ncbi:unnamed protein product [Malus baccata var. baccata]
MADKKWIIQANKELYQMQDVSTEEEHWSRAGLLRALPFYSNPMEEHKRHVLLHFLKRCEKPMLADDTDRFLQLTILDGCFMLEVVRVASHLMDDYAPNDHIFSNQEKLHIMSYIKYQGFVIKLLIEFYSLSATASSIGQCMHSLDVYRKSQLQGERYCKTGHTTELNEAEIRFKKSKTTILRLLTVVMDDTTESMFLNLIALERFHVGAGNKVTSYMFFMDNIIDNVGDVALLHAKFANLFNSLSKDITLDPDSSFNAPWNVWCAILVHTYFRNPWAIISLIVGVFLFVLTIAETEYSINPYYFPNDDHPTCICYLNNSTTHVTPPNVAYSTSPSRFIIYFVLMFVVWMLMD